MNHKDLLDDVIAGMTSRKEIPEEPTIPEEVDENDGNYMEFRLSTGSRYRIDANTFDWNASISTIPSLMENSATFLKIQHDLIMCANEDTKESKVFINGIISQLTEYLKGNGIEVDYREMNNSLTDYQIAQFLLWDVNNVVNTYLHHITMYSAIAMLSAPGGMTDTDDEAVATDDKNTVYRVEVTKDEDGLIIDNIVATNDYPIDEIDVFSEIENGNLVGYVVAKSVIGASERAIELLNDNEEEDTEEEDVE